MKRILKITTLVILSSIALIFLLIWAADSAIVRGSKNYIFDSIEQVPDGLPILVLGTSPVLQNGNPNAFFVFRMEAARDLYNAGKAKAIVVSGDNRRKNYNEPRYMTDALVAFGVPTEIIHRDYAGFRTHDSVIRMHKIFGQDTFIIVSQKFHNARAVYIARRHGFNAYGFNAQTPNQSIFVTRVREPLARVKVFVDILTNRQPHFLGEPIEII